MNPAELLERIAKSLRDDVAPAVAGEYPKTQAFMAAVVLQKLGREVALAEEHRAADAADLRMLADDLVRWRGAALHARRPALDASTMMNDAPDPSAVPSPPPAHVGAAIEHFAAAPTTEALCAIIESLYAAHAELDRAQFDTALGRIRTTLRSQIDRRLAFAK